MDLHQEDRCWHYMSLAQFQTVLAQLRVVRDQNETHLLPRISPSWGFRSQRS
jgi:hypothetical protein